MINQHSLTFTKVIQEKVKDYGSSFEEFQTRVYPKLRAAAPSDRGGFHRRNLTILIEGSDIRKKAELYSEFGDITFPDLRRLILQLENLSKHIAWCKAYNGNLKWSLACLTWHVQLGNEAALLTQLLRNLNRSESRRKKKMAAY